MASTTEGCCDAGGEPGRIVLHCNVIRAVYLPTDTILPEFCVLMNHTSQRFQAVKGVVLNSWKSYLVQKGRDAIGLEKLRYDRISVWRIWSVKNQEVWFKYDRRRRHLISQPRLLRINRCLTQGHQGVYRELNQNLWREKNEVYLFHGTKEESIVSIVKHGLHISTRYTLFGEGIYLAESATKSDQYTDKEEDRRSKNDEPLYMLCCRVALGKIFYKSGVPLPSTEELKSLGYNSIVSTELATDGSEGHFRKLLFWEFVVFEPEQVYPAYIVEYKRLIY